MQESLLEDVKIEVRRRSDLKLPGTIRGARQPPSTISVERIEGP